VAVSENADREGTVAVPLPVMIDDKICEVRMDANAYVPLWDQDRTALAKQLWIRWWYIYRRHHPNEQHPTGLVVRIFDLNGHRIGDYL